MESTALPRRSLRCKKGKNTIKKGKKDSRKKESLKGVKVGIISDAINLLTARGK